MLIYIDKIEEKTSSNERTSREFESTARKDN